MPFFAHLLESLILIVSLSTDAFTASLAYGASKIKVSFPATLVISGICSGMLMLAMYLGNLLSRFLPSQLTHWLCFMILMLIGLTKLFDNCIKSYIRKHNRIYFDFSSHELKFIFSIYADVERADCDHSHTLSVQEASALALALSLDSLTVGLGASISGSDILLPCLLSLFITFLTIQAGCAAGARLHKILPFNLSYLSAILFMILAIMRLL